MTTLRERARSGAPLVGTFLNLGSALAAEVCALSGFDWLLVDLEHGAGGEEGLVGQLLAGAAHGVPVLVRTESDARIRVGHALDLGAAGVMFPRLTSAREVADAVAHLWYPPRGDRGIAGYNRARAFGADPRDDDAVNDAVLGVVQIETLGALESVEAIARTPGVDVVFVGPSDLSAALGIPGQFEAPAFLTALRRVVAAAHDGGIAAGTLVGTPERLPWFLEHGFTFNAVASDSALLRGAAAAALTHRAP